ncbi:MAG TPA: hypothetical protein VKD69_14500, partial [Vicinamibacterales bacterium]|nr:hypothetical protein [Vicinamibacterales bacterium]
DAPSARRRGVDVEETLDPPLVDAHDPGIGPTGAGTVMLIDEIDKADPDLPNNLLEPLGSLQFTVQETGRRVRTSDPPLVFITTNDERELPAAFYRRCAVLFLKKHDPDDLIRIAAAHFATHEPPVTRELARRVAEKMNDVAAEALRRGWRPPSTAEYLDAVRACLELGVDPQRTGDWEHIEQLTLSKQEPPDVTKSQQPASA